MTAFEDFVTRELSRQSTHLTANLCEDYTGDPNDSAAPAIVQNSPVGTWFLKEEDPYIWYRKNKNGVWVTYTGTLSDTTIYVDPVNGSDTNPGTSDNPIKTHKKASELIGLATWGVVVQYLAGDIPIDINNTSEFTERALFGGKDLPVYYRGTQTIEESFTVLSVDSSGLIIQKDTSTPNWTAGEHAGKLADIGWVRPVMVADNTVDKIQVTYNSNQLGSGSVSPPAISSSVDIINLDSQFVAGNSNRVNISGYATLEYIKLNGLSVYADSADGFNLRWANALNGTRLAIGQGGALLNFCYIKDALSYAAGVETYGSGNLTIQNTCFDNCSIGVDVWSSYCDIGHGTMIYKNCESCVRVRDGAYCVDYSNGAIFDTCDQMVYMLFGRASYTKRDYFNRVTNINSNPELDYYVYMYETVNSVAYFASISQYTGSAGAIVDFRVPDGVTFNWSDMSSIYDYKFTDASRNSIIGCGGIPSKNVQEYEFEFLNGLGLWDSSAPASQPVAISDPSGGTTIDSEARTAINSILSALRLYGIIDT